MLLYCCWYFHSKFDFESDAVVVILVAHATAVAAIAAVVVAADFLDSTISVPTTGIPFRLNG